MTLPVVIIFGLFGYIVGLSIGKKVGRRKEQKRQGLSAKRKKK